MRFHPFFGGRSKFRINKDDGAVDLANLFLEFSIALGVPQLVPNARLESEAVQLVDQLLSVSGILLDQRWSFIPDHPLSFPQRLPAATEEERAEASALTDASNSSTLLVAELATVANALSSRPSVNSAPLPVSPRKALTLNLPLYADARRRYSGQDRSSSFIDSFH